jgi:RND superfamily putative drug exporter
MTDSSNITLTEPEVAGRGSAGETQGRARNARVGVLASIGGWAARRRRAVLIGWVLILVAVTIGSHALGGAYGDSLTIPGSPAQQGLDALKAHDPRAGGQGGQVVFVDDAGPITSERSAVEAARSNLSELPHVLSVSDPLSANSVSNDGRTSYASINFDVNPQSLGASYVGSVTRATDVARRAGVRVSYGGALGQAAAPAAKDRRSEMIGIAVALIVLLAGFGSVFGAQLPLFSAVVGVFTGLGLLGILAASVSFGTSSPTLATMMGLGLGIDYALFLTTRYRQRLLDGEDPATAIRGTMAGSGRSVVVAAVTVVIAMLGLYGSGISFIGKLGLAASITVAVAALSALTLVPALLAFAGERIDRFHVRAPVAEPANEHSPLHRYTAAIARHPWRYALGGIAFLAVLTVPAFSMQIGHVGPGSQPPSYSERQAYDAISRAFGPGANGPLTVVAQLPKTAGAQQTQSLESSLTQALQSAPDVRSVGKFTTSPDGAVLMGKVTTASGPDSQRTQTLVQHLQDQTLPSVLSPDHATGYVTGTTAATIDFQNTVSSRLPIIVGVVLLAAFVLLLVAFRSPVLALKAALLNLLSIGAAYGIIVAAFQWGWGAGLLGLSGTVPIESYVPMIIFAIVFGLSMDYEVFLISRIREHWLQTNDNHHSVATGLSQTARVISCAALIMASVFFAFLLSTNVVVKMLALGLGVSVIIDATIIRLLIVPSLMFLFDKANWWTPRWLDRALPPPGARERVGHRRPGQPSAGAGHKARRLTRPPNERRSRPDPEPHSRAPRRPGRCSRHAREKRAEHAQVTDGRPQTWHG